MQKLLTALLLILSTAFAAFGQNDLSLSVSTASGTVAIGDNVTFTITVNNQAATSVTGVEVTNLLPAGMNYVSHTVSAGSYTSGSGVWNIGSISGGTSSVTMSLEAEVTAEGVQLLQSSITDMNEFDGDSDPTNPSPLEDDFAAACVTVPISYCTGDAINVTASAPAGHTSYQWFKNGSPIGSATSQTYNITEEGSFTYQVDGGSVGACESGNCCPLITEFILTPTAGITNNESPATTVLTCANTDISLTATGGTSYAWSNGLGNTANAAPTTPGTYTVTVTAANGCTSTAQITITQDITAPTAGITNNTGDTELTCSLTSISVTATGGTSYAWSDGLGSSANASIIDPGTYTVTVTGSNGCTATSQIVITEDVTPPTAGITNNESPATTELTCANTSISLTATGGTSYAWSGGLGNTASAAPTAPGTYTVTVTAANGCTATAQITITQDIVAPTAGITNNAPGATTELTCTTTSIPVTATGGTSYAWSDGLGSSANASITDPGTYTVTVTGSNGCTATSQITITEDITAPTAGITNNESPATTELTCANTEISLTATGGTSYAWSGGIGNTASVAPTAPGTYTVTVTGSNGCTATAQITITQDITAPTAGININSPGGTTELTCAVTSIPLTAIGGTSYAWSGGLGNTAAVAPTAPGTYTVTVTGSNGCTATAQVTITQDITAPTAGITNTTPGGTTELTCNTTEIDLTATGGSFYNWSGGLGNVASVQVTAPGTYTVTVTGTNGCTSTAQITITEDVTPPAAAIASTAPGATTTITCLQTSIPLTASGGTAYAWSNGLGNTASVSVTTAGTYTVTVTGTNGCTATAQVTITGACTVDYGDLPDASVGGDYSTTAADNGPSHGIITGLSLGNDVDADTDGQPSANADGDDTDVEGDDDEGLTVGSTIDIAPGGTIRLPIEVTNTTGDTAFVVIFIDWNGDGDFGDPGEEVISLNDGTNPFPGYVTINVPAGVDTSGPIGVIIRVSLEDNVGPTGYVSSGEVESLLISVNCPPVICLPVGATRN